MRIKSTLMLASTLAVFSGAAFAQEMTFGYIPNNMAFPYNVALVDGFTKAAEAKGVKVVVLDSRMSMETQANQIDDLLLQKVNAIGFMPNDSIAVQSLVDKVVEAGVPIAATAVPVGDPAVNPIDYVYPKLTALVTSNDVEAGRVAGRLALELLPKDRKVKIGVVEGAPGFAVVKQRQDGFEEVLKGAGVDYEIVASQPSDWTAESGESICQNMLTATPDIDLIHSHADPMSVGCARALDAVGSKAFLVDSGGGSTLGMALVAAGDSEGSACNAPFLLGELTFNALFEAVSDPAAAKTGQYISPEMVAVVPGNTNGCAPW